MNDIIKNKKASFEYEILDSFDAGIILMGWEVKSILSKMCSITESYVTIKNNELFLKNCNINLYNNVDGFSNKDENRDRKLLLNKHEINKIKKQLDIKGFTAVPLKIFYSDTKKIKIKIGIAKGKKIKDKRNDLKEKQIKRDIQRDLKGRI